MPPAVSGLHLYPTRQRAEHAVAAALPPGKKRVALSGTTMSIALFEEKLLDQYVPDSAIGEVENWLLLHEAVTAEPIFRKNPRLAEIGRASCRERV